MITKIDYIKNMGVFNDFQWNKTVRGSGNNIGNFEKINILYGNNYSGKTTLSRIFRSFETKKLPEKYGSIAFQLSENTNNPLNQNTLSNHPYTFRVFNSDFIKDNLQFIFDENKSINAFAILGEENRSIEENIDRLESELGNEEEKTGLKWELSTKNDELSKAKTHFKNKDDNLRKQLQMKAKSIKHKTEIYNKVIYTITEINQDINTLKSENYSGISPDSIENYKNTLNETAKPEIHSLSNQPLTLTTLIDQTKALIETKITASEPIQELLDDSTLAKWVRDGREHHRNKRETCAFCNNPLTEALWCKLDNHFNRQSEDIKVKIGDLIGCIKQEQTIISNFLPLDQNLFYEKFKENLKQLSTERDQLKQEYQESLNQLINQLNQRNDAIFEEVEFDTPSNPINQLNTLTQKFESLRNQSNNMSKNLNTEQATAREKLRLEEVYQFTQTINYDDEQASINESQLELNKLEEEVNKLKTNISTKEKSIIDLKNQLKNESKGAEKVNHYLNDFFGHPFLKLEAVKQDDIPENAYKFEITRNGKKAHHLSEGEQSLIAFCYFMAKLEDINTANTQPIIWIDDPISSLDANHIFFIYSLIDTFSRNDKTHYQQLFISTHNLDFLKYLKQLGNCQYYMINRTNDVSQITKMPDYLKIHVTEFSYLFHQIYKCAYDSINPNEHPDFFYNFGNNARKFLEIYLYYKYPNTKKNKLERFFKNDSFAYTLVNRIINEYSHLKGRLEHGMKPLEEPEMQKAARFILQKIKQHDAEQYQALLESIGKTEKPELKTA